MSNLPSFTNPPVQRVSAAALIDGANPAVRSLIDYYREHLSETYERVHEHQPSVRPLERPWDGGESERALASMFSENASLQLHGFTPDREWSVRVQSDWISVTWSRREDPYPRWAAVRSKLDQVVACLLYTSPSPRDRQKSRMPSSA